jgi:hypothetical protein
MSASYFVLNWGNMLWKLKTRVAFEELIMGKNTGF